MTKARGKYKSSAHIKRVKGKKPHNFIDNVESKHCNDCNRWVPVSNFHKRARNWDGLYDYCKDCTNIQNRKSYHRHGDERRARSREWQKENAEWRRDYVNGKYREMKEKVFEAYGARCAFCGFDDRRALCIDHVDGKGRQQRLKGDYGATFLRRIIRENYPDDYQILCANCNMIKMWDEREVPYSLAVYKDVIDGNN